MSRDPLGLWGDPGQDGNAQRYCGNNPVGQVDPYGLAGSGHHVIPQELWDLFNMSDAAKRFFDSDEARIWHEYYTWHSGRRQFGISHFAYNRRIGELVEVYECLMGKKASKWTAADARDFLRYAKENSLVKRFLRGIRIERQIAIWLAHKGIQKGGRKPANLKALVQSFLANGGTKALLAFAVVTATMSVARAADEEDGVCRSERETRMWVLELSWEILSPLGFLTLDEAAEVYDQLLGGAWSSFRGASEEGGVFGPGGPFDQMTGPPMGYPR